jgi:hypothetical protein
MHPNMLKALIKIAHALDDRGYLYFSSQLDAWMEKYGLPQDLCESCWGEGKETKTKKDPYNNMVEYAVECSKCDGSGKKKQEEEPKDIIKTPKKQPAERSTLLFDRLSPENQQIVELAKFNYYIIEDAGDKYAKLVDYTDVLDWAVYFTRHDANHHPNSTFVIVDVFGRVVFDDKDFAKINIDIPIEHTHTSVKQWLQDNKYI